MIKLTTHAEFSLSILIFRDKSTYRNKIQDDKNLSEFEITNDLVIIDLQMSRIGSPASDILYLLGSSTSMDSRKANLEQWLSLYHEILLEDLATFGYPKDVFTYENLLDEINYLWSFALETGIFHAEVKLD